MKINNQTLFSIILICFALAGKCMSHEKPPPPSSPTPSSSSSPTPPSTSTPLTPSTSTPSTSTPSTSTPSTSTPTPYTPSTSTPTPNTPSTSTPTPNTPSTPTPSTPSPSTNNGRKTKTSSSYYSETSDQSSDTPYIDAPSGSPSATKGGSASFGISSSFSASFSDYLKVKRGDKSKIKYNPSLQQICSRTHHADVCLATISPLLKHKFDAIHVLEASIIVCTQNLKAIVARIERHVVGSHVIATSLLIDCQKHYTKALMNLHKALKAIHARNFALVTKMLSAAVADVSTAESKIVDLKVNIFRVEYFSFVSFTASNCLSIASLVPN
ncbi:hypothetical protein TanjilG_27037 [Lupinus angustifolius]|uniref:Pectinesterase inhibitor domain-containing protein n=1 Tax=Lupinus angustifolius TaxID=3871 RepID=A0A4P1QVS2_LUPAN|nr:hypothetical protein TanjilG_27037 [Lupinus angustifolius]